MSQLFSFDILILPRLRGMRKAMLKDFESSSNWGCNQKTRFCRRPPRRRILLACRYDPTLVRMPASFSGHSANVPVS